MNGINIRYLYSIYENTNMSFIKGIVASEIMARTCKNIVRKTLQDIHLVTEPTNDLDEFNKGSLSKIIDLLNCIVGSTY